LGPNSFSFPTSYSQLYNLSTFFLLFPPFWGNMLTFLLLCACVRVRMCVRVRHGLYLICCLRNTITFLLSDRVSRHTRDRARQCALETGDRARAPEPSASFADREPSTPLEITRRLALLHTHTHTHTHTLTHTHTDTDTTSCEIPVWDYFIREDSTLLK